MISSRTPTPFADGTAVPRRLSDAVHAAASRLAQAGVPTPDVDAELLAAHAWGTTRGALQAGMVRGDGSRPRRPRPSSASSTDGPRGSRCSTSRVSLRSAT